MDPSRTPSSPSPTHSPDYDSASISPLGDERDSPDGGGSVSALSFSSEGEIAPLRILIIQNYAGTGGTEGVAEQLIDGGKHTYSFCELISSVLRFMGTEGRDLFTTSAEVFTKDSSGTRKEIEITVMKEGSFERSEVAGSPKLIPRLREVALKTGAIGERIIHKVRESGGRYYNLELAARTEKRAGALTTGLLDESHEIHETARQKLSDIILRENPDLIYVAQDHATRVVIEVAEELGKPVVYGIHREDLSTSSLDKSKNACVTYNASASKDGKIAKIIGCSTSVLENFASVGGEIDADRFHIVENGVDFQKFQRKEESRAKFRSDNGIAPHEKVITIAGRYSVEKDFFTFIRSAVQALKIDPTLHFVMCGSNVTSENRDLQTFLTTELERADIATLSTQFHLLGFQDMPQVFSGSDVVMSTSATESWGLTLLEGAAAGNIIVHSDIPGMNHAMKDVSLEFRVTREEVKGETIGTIKCPRLTDESIAQYTEKMLMAVEASNHPEKVKQFVDRAIACSIETTVDLYEKIFAEAVRGYTGD